MIDRRSSFDKTLTDRTDLPDNASSADTISSTTFEETESPAIHAWDVGKGFIIHAYLPGVSMDGIKVEIHDGKVYITAQTSDMNTRSPTQSKVRERRFGFESLSWSGQSSEWLGACYKLCRVISLPPNALPLEITSKFKDSNLEIQIPKISTDYKARTDFAPIV